MQISIRPFGDNDIKTLVDISRETFVQSHGHSANPEAIKNYLDTQFTSKILSDAVQDSRIYYSKIVVDEVLAGYTKLILNEGHPHTELHPIAKFERVYLLKDYHGLGLGKKLLEHNISLAKKHEQKALWLYVWTENEKGIKFYNKHGFQRIGMHDFKISDDCYNPNYVMLKTI